MKYTISIYNWLLRFELWVLSDKGSYVSMLSDFKSDDGTSEPDSMDSSEKNAGFGGLSVISVEEVGDRVSQ